MKKILMVLMVVLMMFTSACQLSEQSVITQPDTGKTITGEEDFCANNPSLDLGVRALNILATSTEYDNASFYLKNLKTGSVVERAIDDSTGVFDTHSNVLKCGNDAGYEIIVKTTQDGLNAGEDVIVIKPEELFQDPVEKTLKISKHTLVQAKAYDADGRVAMGVGAVTAYDTLPAVFNETSGSAITIGADGYLDVEFTLAPATSNEAGGKEAMICVNYADDSNVDDWEETSLDLMFEGTGLSEATLSANDAMALSAYEKCYALPHPVGKTTAGEYDSVSKLNFYIKSQAGVNPDFSPVLRYVELGSYQSSKDQDNVLTGVVAQDNSARTFLGSATASTITVAIV